MAKFVRFEDDMWINPDHVIWVRVAKEDLKQEQADTLITLTGGPEVYVHEVAQTVVRKLEAASG